MIRTALAVAALVFATPAGGDAARIYLGLLPVENPAHVHAEFGRARVRLVFVPDASRKASELRQRFPSAREESGALTVVADTYAPSRQEPEPGDRAASFLIDFDEPDFVPLKKAIVERYGGQPSAADLRRFSGEHVVTKNYARGFDIASRVARRREGDCKEHAILMAALARLFGKPARVVLGVVLIPAGDSTVAAGHAWTEIHEGGAWRAFDATDTPASALRVPLSTLRDEGPGFAIGVLQLLHPLDLAAVTLEPAVGMPADP